MYDIAIVGAGPAGWSAAITARMRNHSVCVIKPHEDDSWLRRAEKIENYPGMPNISGSDLLDAYANHALAMGTEVQVGVVRQMMPQGQGFMLLAGNDVVEAKTVILAIGAGRAKTLPGEEDLIGRGVSYCGTCDGMFYRGKRVAVLSSGAHGMEEAHFLAGLAGEIAYFPLRKHDMSHLDKRARVVAQRPLAIEKTDEGLALRTDKETHMVDGIFIFRPAVALNQLLPSLKTSGSAIHVNRRMETNIPGLYAAGDCTGDPKQIAKAVGEGNIAAIVASEHIENIDESTEKG